MRRNILSNMKTDKAAPKKEKAPKESLDDLKKVAEQLQKDARELLQKTPGAGLLKSLKLVHVGTKILDLRSKQGHSQLEVSRNTGLSQSYLSRIESGDVVAPSRDVLERLASFFHIAPRNLTKGTSSAPVLDEIRLADRYGYCPNIECPGTVYRFFSVNRGGWEDYTVKEFESVQHAHLYGYTDYDEYLASEYHGELLEKFRANEKSLEIAYRWIELEENTRFCELCGTKLRSSCPHCETPLKVRNQKFCHKCGRQLNKSPEHEEGGKKK